MKPGANECKMHRLISLIRHIAKVVFRYPINTASRIRPGIAQEQCGFVEDTGTKNATFIRRLSEKPIHVQKDV